jgi:hypothetical protein
MPRDYFERFFNVIEDVLKNGDDLARDSISIQIGEGLLASGVAAEKFSGFYGSEQRDVPERIRTWPKPKDHALSSRVEYSEIGRADLTAMPMGVCQGSRYLKRPVTLVFVFSTKTGGRSPRGWASLRWKMPWPTHGGSSV